MAQARKFKAFEGSRAFKEFDASFFRSGSGGGLSEPVMEFPAILGVLLTTRGAFRILRRNVVSYFLLCARRPLSSSHGRWKAQAPIVVVDKEDEVLFVESSLVGPGTVHWRRSRDS